MATILFTGATGKVSSATIAMLKGTDHRLIGLVRDPSKAKHLGIELRVGDLEKPRTLEGAFNGVDTAFLLAPPGGLAPFQSSNGLFAAREAGVRHVVRMSAVGAAHDAPTVNSRLHALSDMELAASGLAYTILKPHFFAQNLMMAAQPVVDAGVLYMAFGDAKLPMVDIADIAAVAAKVLSEPAAHAGKTYTLTGPTAVSMHDVVAALSGALGKAVKYVPVPIAEFVAQFAQAGADDFTQVSSSDYFTAYSRGWRSQVTNAVERITGKPPRGLAEFAREFAAALER